MGIIIMGGKKRTVFHELIKSPEHYEEIVENSHKQVAIIDCYSDDFGPCNCIIPSYQLLFNTYDAFESRGAFYHYPESNMTPEMAEKLKLDCIPRFLFIKDGSIFKELKGMYYVEFE